MSVLTPIINENILSVLKIFRKPFFIFISLIVAAILLVLLNFLGLIQPAKSLTLRIISPFTNGVSLVGRKVSNFFHFWGQIRNLTKENNELREEVKTLMVDKAKFEQFEKENEILREQLDYQKYSEHKILPAFTIGFDPNNLLQIITLNRGKKQGIKKGMAIVAGKGVLVGQIQEADFATSSGLLITDGNSRIPAKILDSQADGVLRGEHGLGLVMEMIPQDKQIKPKDLVVTSDLGGKVPKDLVIGEIEEILSSENELFQRARIKSPVDFKELESVYAVIE